MKLSEEKFKLAVLLKKFILDSENLLLNVPRNDYYNRDRFRDLNKLKKLHINYVILDNLDIIKKNIKIISI